MRRNHDSLESLLFGYYKAYYSELRRRMSHYPSAHRVFPYYLTGHREIVAIKTIDGFVVSHWPAQQDSFSFIVEDKKRVVDITERFATVLPNGYRCEYFSRDPENPEQDFNYAATAMAPEVEFNNQIVRPEWVRLDVAGFIIMNEQLYSKTKAHDDAERDIAFSASAYLMGLSELPADKQQSSVLLELDAAIREFEKIIGSDPEELNLQYFLGIPRNKILLDPIAKTVTPEVKLGSEYRVDFVLELPQEKYVLVEIERPRDSLYTKEGDPAHRHKHGQQQIMDWIEWLNDNKDYARKTIPSLDSFKEANSNFRLIIGLRRNMSEKHQKALARKNAELHRIETVTFDDLLTNAKQHCSNLKKLL